jgi:hypothetical protein
LRLPHSRRELGFEGVPHRETVLVLPTVNCLVELTQMPFTVVALGDIEIINLERVGFNLKNFDMAIVFKVGGGDCWRCDVRHDVAWGGVGKMGSWVCSVTHTTDSPYMLANVFELLC